MVLSQQEMFDFLMTEGLVYRYPTSDWSYIEKNWPGHMFPSPHQVLNHGQRMIEEMIQPLCEPIVISEAECNQLETLADALNWYFHRTMQFAKGEYKSSFSKTERENILKMTASSLERREIERQKVSPSQYSHPMPFTRLDCLRTNEGFKVVDINSTRPAGVGEQIVLNYAFADSLDSSTMTLPLEELFLDCLSDCYQEWLSRYGKGNTIPKVAIALTDEMGDFRNFLILQQSIKADKRFDKCEIIIGDFDRLATFDLVIRGKIKEGINGFSKIASLHPEKTCVISPPFNRWLGNKLWFYYFLGPLAGMYRQSKDDPLYDALTKAFPRTGIIDCKKKVVVFPDEKVNMWQLPRKQYLLKPGKGSSAKGVVFGCDSNRGKWEEALDDAKPDTIVQEFCPVKEKVKILDQFGRVKEDELYTKYGVFIFNGRLAGLEVMVRPSKIVHGARDTYYAPVFVQKGGEQ